ncbi:hypothetical protein [Thermanaeromonas toyohensis]|uniref:hypothetical protein n=1 Tax=Thermanaeromonas toyohensis TaxID=161154 RepID=UPI0012F4A3F9|nr:hypothetical protein [Thermanaeromonas toyohensis]
MGPCQGTFCIWRGALHLYRQQVVNYEACLNFIERTIEERWKGNKYVLWGDQARQIEIMRGIYGGNFRLGGE